MRKILISACLLGRRVRYDGAASTVEDELIGEWNRQGRLVAVCPEVAGGLSVPRPAAEIVGGTGEDVLAKRARLETKSGLDVTAAFLAGAEEALALAREHDVALAILKARSPSCGALQIYDGTFSGTRRHGMGVTAALLRAHSIPVFNEEQLHEAAIYLQDLQQRG